MTPLLKLKTAGDLSSIWVKIESLTGSGSSKERICSAIISDAVRRGAVQPGKTTVVEATSGNTGIAISFLCAAMGCKVALFMPENTFETKKAVAKAYGAGIFETPADEGMKGAVKKAGDFAALSPDTRFFLNQFSNPLNPETHKIETAKEILHQMGKTENGKIDAFVMGVGTGGTVTGVGMEIKKAFAGAKVVAVEPSGSAVLSGGKPGGHCISGIGAGFVPDVLDTAVYDTVIAVTDSEAQKGVAQLARNNGFFAGLSSGANYIAAARVAKELGPGKRVVTIICDSGERYLAGQTGAGAD